jgi:predicted ATPase/class 3 adenylate cyclase
MLFSDIEGSTSLLYRLGIRYAEVLDVQRRVLRSAWQHWGGTEMGTEGDSFFVVFEAARDAVHAASQAQRELALQNWPGGEQVRVRMGLNTGEPVAHDGGYVGIDVHRAARIAAAAHGGQVVVTNATRQLVAETLPADTEWVDLGLHRLKDFAAPVHAYQLSMVGLPDSFPPLKTLGTTSSLPMEATALVGRDAELRELTKLLGRPGVRLVTLTGAGGSGKTRLATALAVARAESFLDGVFFVSLAGVTSNENLWAAVIDALGMAGEARTRQQSLAQLANRRLLMILDNLEQIPDAGAVVDELLASAPQVVVLVTSRRPLHVRGEHEHPVPPLELPERDGLADVKSSGAVQLFCQYVQMVRPGFALTSQNAGDVAAVCRRLDGLPLAVELAAVRSKLLSPVALLARLKSTVDLRDHATGRPVRQRTLRDTIAWSYDLLPEDLQVVFRRLGVFAGGADMEAIDAVATSSTGDGDPLDAAAGLVDVSLVSVAEDSSGEPRVVLLQTVADFALDRLTAEGDLENARERHAEHYLALAQTLVPEAWTGQGLAVRQRLETESNNFRAALSWALQTDTATPPTPEQARLGLRLCAALCWFWDEYGYVPECRGWYERALEVGSGIDTRERASVMVSLAGLGDLPAGDPRPLELLEQSLAISRRLSDKGVISDGLGGLAELHLLLGDFSTATDLIEESIALARQLGDNFRLEGSVGLHGRVEVELGNPARAKELFEQAREFARQRGDENSVVWFESFIAYSLVVSGRPREAWSRLQSIEPDVLRISGHFLSYNVLATYAQVFAALGDAQRAARLLGGHWAHYTKLGAVLDPQVEEAWLQRTGIASVRDTLGQDRWQQALQVGSAYTLEEALADARAAGEP